jgi:hypothetical protein
MRKLLHLVFAVWKTGKPFDPNHYPWEPAVTRRRHTRDHDRVGHAYRDDPANR